MTTDSLDFKKLDNIGFGIAIVDDKGTFLFANRKFSKILGIQKQRLIGSSLKKFLKEKAEFKLIVEKPYGTKEICFLKDEKKSFPTITSWSSSEKEFSQRNILLTLFDVSEYKEIEFNLKERVKELKCLYSISELFEQNDLTLDDLLQNIVEIIPNSWQLPAKTSSRITINKKKYSTKNFKPSTCSVSSKILVNGEAIGLVEVSIVGYDSKSIRPPFLEEEKVLIKSIAERIGKIIELKIAQEQRKMDASKLEESNITLRNILQHIEKEKIAIKENVFLNVEKNIKPLIDKMKRTNSFTEENLELLNNYLDSLSSGFYRRMINLQFNLTPAETNVAQMIKSGYQLKEIARINNVSITTIKTHVKNIRRKFGLIKKSQNLKVFLSQFD